MAPEQIVLFDIPTKPPRTTWSLNPWKTRLVLASSTLTSNLDYKGSEFASQTVWRYAINVCSVEPDLDGDYTIPTIILPDGTYVMDSRKIVDVINGKYPEPALKVETKYLDWFGRNYGKLMGRLRGVYVPNVVKRLLDPYAHEYWYQTREKSNGMPLDQLERELGGQKAWEMAAPLLQELTGLLKENEGPFFEGDEVTYVDFVWVGALLFIQKIGEDFFEELLKAAGDAKPHLGLLEGCKQWTDRRDY
ncbi:hypothetical protein OQA88_3509 [Cercophora sp. LCS_1]